MADVPPVEIAVHAPVIQVEGAPAEAAEALRKRIEAAFVFSVKHAGWPKPELVTAAPLVVVVTDLPKGTMASASGPGRFSISKEALGSQSADGVFAHELTHVEDFRAVGSALGKVPRYLEEGRGLVVGRAYRSSRNEPAGDEARARLLVRLTAEEAKEALALFRDGAGAKKARERGLFARCMSVSVFFLDYLAARAGHEDALSKLSKVWIKVGEGAEFEKAFYGVFGQSLSELERGFVAFVKKTEGSAADRLQGTAYAVYGQTELGVPVMIQSPDQIAQHLGKVVTLQGPVERFKQATLLGVDVESSSPDLRGKQAWATGRLEAYETDDPTEGGLIRADRGAGKYTRLVDPVTGRLAQVRDGPFGR